MNPGIYYDLPIEQYHGNSLSVSKSGLDDLALCPAMFYALHLDPDRPARSEKAGHLEGNLAHCALLEPEEFSKRYAVLPKDAPSRPTPAQWKAVNSNESSTAAKEWWTAWNKANGGARIITADQGHAARCQAHSMRSLTNVWGGLSMADMLARGKTEVSAYWNDPITGVLCRCRPDLVVPINARQVVLVDVKTYSEATSREFMRQVVRKRYFMQDSWYSEGYARASGMEVVGFVFVVVEDKWPFLAASYQLGDESRHEGALQHRDLLDTYAECMRTNVWPGYTKATETLDLPPYAITSQEIEISYVD
ncbi:exodeoxyribonuclease VIII [Variovorax boronicumulans]|uniref:PD-(D/E)XK nuclease-like domain-containing protein n=1 Tax=Variovorax boronicumulans TaxID=436515 RepID=UPI002789154D|nr:PD-(D/E)XK nuclease-like domain-containing protein [Variovorax boronicumulans]MDQ0035876.1 exodeoxyribonuclease VIII [Variovorax boronicumulans]